MKDAASKNQIVFFFSEVKLGTTNKNYLCVVNVLNKLEAYIKEHNLLNKQQDCLVAVSGGVDSVCLVVLLKQLGYNIAMAHCNFQLRGAESDRDELFATQLANELNLPFFLKKVDTEVYADVHKLSIQEAARNIRYDFFKEIINAETGKRFSKIATAHNLNDDVETTVAHFFKGSGLKGLAGIPLKNGNIIRPLLGIKRADLEAYATAAQIDFVTDSSNLSNKYLRNYIRLNVLTPLVNAIPEAVGNAAHSVALMKDSYALLKDTIDRKIDKLVKQEGQHKMIPIRLLKKEMGFKTLLFHFLMDYNFSAKQVNDVVKLFDAQNSSYVQSDTHKIIKNREWLILANNDTQQSELIIIESYTKIDFEKGAFEIAPTIILNHDDALSVSVSQAALVFPLQLRKVKQGDYFYPLGMSKKKKLSRFFIDLKLSAIEKENVWVVTSQERIVWVVGYRIDNRFAIRNNEKMVQLKVS